MKPQSVRSQRSFAEHMKTLYQNIDTMVYAAEIACVNSEAKCIKPESDCPFIFNSLGGITCSRYYIRQWVGDHFPQGDIKEVELSEG